MKKYEPQTKPHTLYKRITEIRRKFKLCNTRENLCDRRLGRVLRCGTKTTIHKRKICKVALHPNITLLLCRRHFKEHEKMLDCGRNTHRSVTDKGLVSRRLLRVLWTARSNQSILKEINSEYSLEGLMLKLKLQYFGHMVLKDKSLAKSMMLGKVEGRRRRGVTEDKMVG